MREFLIQTCMVCLVAQTLKKAREGAGTCTQMHMRMNILYFCVVCLGLNGCATLMKFFVFFIEVLSRYGLLHCQGIVDDRKDVQKRPQNSFSC